MKKRLIIATSLLLSVTSLCANIGCNPSNASHSRSWSESQNVNIVPNNEQSNQAIIENLNNRAKATIANLTLEQATQVYNQMSVVLSADIAYDSDIRANDDAFAVHHNQAAYFARIALISKTELDWLDVCVMNNLTFYPEDFQIAVQNLHEALRRLNWIRWNGYNGNDYYVARCRLSETRAMFAQVVGTYYAVLTNEQNERRPY